MYMTVSARYLMTHIETLAGFGVDQHVCFSVLDLAPDGLNDPKARIDIDAVLALLNHAENLLGDPLIGLRLGHKFRINAFAQTGNIYSYCADMHAVIAANARFQCLAIDAGAATYHQTQEVKDGVDVTRHFMTFTPYYDDVTRYRHITNLIMGAYGTAYRWLSWASGEDLKSVALPYAPPSHTDFHDSVFGCPIDFNADAPCIELADGAMTTPLATADAEKHARTTAQLEALLSGERGAACLQTALDTAMSAALKNGAVSMDIVAARLMKTPQALRSELKSHNISYRDSLMSVRQTQFKALFDAGESFAAIAQNLAYNDQAAFSRAFRGWYGCAPGEWAAKQKDTLSS